LPVMPSSNCFTVNNLRQDRHLHTVEVVGSNPAVPTIKSTTYMPNKGAMKNPWEWKGTLCQLVSPLRSRMGRETMRLELPFLLSLSAESSLRFCSGLPACLR
jgi:hypothetical protein